MWGENRNGGSGGEKPFIASKKKGGKKRDECHLKGKTQISGEKKTFSGGIERRERHTQRKGQKNREFEERPFNGEGRREVQKGDLNAWRINWVNLKRQGGGRRESLRFEMSWGLLSGKGK